MHQPSLERAGNAARGLAPAGDVRDDVWIAAGDMAEQHVGMPVGRLGVGSNDDVGAEIERALAERRHRGVVDDDDRARLVRGLGDRCDVANVQSRI